jgi:hypothetical protein
MRQLCDRKTIAGIDRHNMLGLLETFDRQCEDAWKLDVPVPERVQFRNVCFAGMGGSASLPPLEIVHKDALRRLASS